MKRMTIASTVLLCLLFAAFAYASPRQQDEPKSKEATPAAQAPDAKPEAKPETQEQKPDEMKPEKQEKNDQEMKSDKDQEKQDKDQEKQEQKDEKNAGKDNGNMRNDDNHAQHNNAHAKPAGKGGHIPDDKFRASFGRGHTFHPSRPVIVNNQPTFNYGGYSFIMVDAWPAGWAYTDDCYIDYIDGEYFLFDLLHPGVRIELFVSP